MTTFPTDNADQKFCVNCKHIGTNGQMEWETFPCFHPKNEAGFNLVTGARQRKEKYALGVRCLGNMCGPLGEWFEEATEPNGWHRRNNLFKGVAIIVKEDYSSVKEIADAIKSSVRAPKSQLTADDL